MKKPKKEKPEVKAPITYSNDRAVNNRNTVTIIRAYLKAKYGTVALLVLLSLNTFAGSAYVACTIGPNVSKLQLLVATNPFALGSVSQTNYNVATSSLSQTVTNLLTNLVAGVTNYIQARCTSTNGVMSDLSTNLPVYCPTMPTDIQTVTLSLVVPLGTPVQISRDLISWRERFTIYDAPVAQAPTNGTGVSTPPPLSSFLFVWHQLKDQPNFFMRLQPEQKVPLP